MVSLIKESFSKGVIGPALYGRVDVTLYKSALRKALNAIIRPYGGVYKRQGLRYIMSVKDHSYDPRPIPFQYADDDQYMLEFGDFYVRFMRNDGQVLEDPKTIVGISTPSPFTLVTGAPAVVTTSAPHGYSTGDEIYIEGVVGATEANGKNFKISVIDSVKFYLLDQVTGLAVGGLAFGTYVSGGTCERVYEIASPWAKEDLPLLKYVQNKDVMTLVHPDYDEYELRRMGHTSWTLTVPTFAPGQHYPTGEGVVVNGATGAVTYKYKVTAVQDDTLIESIPGLARDGTRVISGITKANPGVITAVSHGFSNGQSVFVTEVVGMTEVNGKVFVVAGATTDTFQLVYDGVNADTTGFGTYASGGIVSRAFSDILFTNPVRITSVSHGYSNNDEIQLDGTGYSELDGQRFSLTNVTTNTFDLSGVNGTTIQNQSVPITQYDPPSGSGDRTSAITVTSNIAFAGGTLNNAVDGGFGNNTTDGLDWPGTGTTAVNLNDYIKLDFRQKRYITKFALSASVVFSVGAALWRIQGSDDDSNWFDYSPAPFLWNNTTLEHTLSGVPTAGRRYWRIICTVAGGGQYPTGFLLEILTQIQQFVGVARRTHVQVTNGNATANNTVAWTAEPGAGSYNIYKFDNGVYGFIGSTSSTSFIDDNINPVSTDTPPGARQPFGDGEHPGAVGYTNQRRVFGGSNQNPETSEYSKVGDTSDFSKSAPLKDDDAITATLVADQLQRIRHYVSLQDLIIMSNSGEWRVNSGPDSAFSAKTIKQKQQTNWGSSHLKPVVVGNVVFFAEPNSSRVRSIGYQYAQDSYDGNDMSILAYHYFSQNYIKAMAFGWSRDQRLYCVRDDGKVATMTFHKDQEVVAWTDWGTRGLFKDVAALRTVTPGAGDGVYFIVKRYVNGSYVRYWEKYEHREVVDIRDAFYVDCGLSYDNPIEITNVGAPAVSIVPNGSFINDVSTGWSLGTNWAMGTNSSIPNSLLVRSALGTTGQTASLTISGAQSGGTYTVAFDVYNVGGTVTGSFKVNVQGGTASAAITTSGRKTLTLTAGSSGTVINFVTDAGGLNNVGIDNVSITPATVPVFVTAPSHGLSVNDLIDVSDVVWEPQYDADDTESQPAQLNGRFYVLTTPTADTFTVSLTQGGSAITTADYPVAYLRGGNIREPVSSVSGLWHLEGQSVRILADGNIFSGTVVNGAISAINGSNKYARIHIGLKYVCDVELLDITVDAGVSEGHSRAVTRVTLQLENSRFPKVSNSEGVLKLSSPNGAELPSGIELYTGQARVTLGSQWNWHGRVLLRHADPTPMNLLYVAEDVQFDDPSN